jgi:cytochrome d ubiquinol oxidase subunit I
MALESNRFGIAVPHLGSLILTHSWTGKFPGLKEYAPQDRPNVPIVFWSFRIMVGLGLLMIALGLWATWARWRGTLYRSRMLFRALLAMGPAGIVAMLAGWITTEVGRQPWVVYGVLRTADAVSPHSTMQMGISLALFVIVYCAVFGAGIAYILRLIGTGPALDERRNGASQPPGGPGRARQPQRPLSAVLDPLGDTADHAASDA